MKILKFMFRLVFGNAIAMFFFWSPVSTLKRNIQNMLTEQLSISISDQITLFNCLLSARYCYVSPNNILMSTINVIGAAIEATYLSIFIMMAPKSEKDKILEVVTFVISFRQSEKSKELSLNNCNEQN